MRHSRFAILLSVAVTSNAILPNYDDELVFENGMSNPVNFDLIKFRSGVKNCESKSPSKFTNNEAFSIDDLNKKLHDKGSAYREKGAHVPVRSIKELGDLMKHPTWLTDSSKKKISESEDRNEGIFGAQAPMVSQLNSKLDDDQSEHIKSIITKFQTYKPKPITDNRITKFVFTHNGDLATSKTVQEHNKEVATAFVDFNKKLEETLNTKKKASSPEKADMKEAVVDDSYNRVVDFLNRNILKLKDEKPHKQVCRNHKSHAKDVEYDVGSPDVFLNKYNRRFNELARTRDGLENVLLGLDRPRIGPFKRQLPKKSNKDPSARLLSRRTNELFPEQCDSDGLILQ